MTEEILLASHKKLVQQLELLGNREDVVVVLVAMAKAKKRQKPYSRSLSRKYIELFLDNPRAMFTGDRRMKGYYETAVAIAKAVCAVGKVVCPFVEDL